MTTRNDETASCIPEITRKQFLKKILQGSAVAGTALAFPKVIDKFLLPAQAASTSSCSVSDTGGRGGASGDRGTSGMTDVVSIITGDTYCGG